MDTQREGICLKGALLLVSLMQDSVTNAGQYIILVDAM